mgnify:CR=1 FL=1
MTADELQELFIEAALIDRRIPNTARPAQMKSMSLPYVADWADMLGWGAERLDEERKDFWDHIGRRLNPADMTLWERASDLITRVSDQSQRRCLLHWSIAKAGGRPFSQWCRKIERIHEETGRRRKDRALLDILAQQSCVNGSSKHELDFAALLPQDADPGINTVNIGKSRSWMAEGSRPLVCDFDFELQEFEWANEQNARRRQREQQKRRAA